MEQIVNKERNKITPILFVCFLSVCDTNDTEATATRKANPMFTIYHITSTSEVGITKGGRAHSAYAKTYASRGAALNTARKMHYKEVGPAFIGPQMYGVAHVDHYRANVVKAVTRTNLLSGKAYQEASNTPGYCSPSSEAYWSM